MATTRSITFLFLISMSIWHMYHIRSPKSVKLKWSIPDGINKRLSNISSDRRSFDSAAPPYQEALRKSGFDYNLSYNPQTPKPKRDKKRNTIWFNPPHSANVATDIGNTNYIKFSRQKYPSAKLQLHAQSTPNHHGAQQNYPRQADQTLRISVKRVQLPSKGILPPPWKMSNRMCCVPGHSNNRRQPTERNLRWTYRRHIYNYTVQPPHKLV